MSSLRSEKIRKSRRKRECFTCGRIIQKGEYYRNIELRYDFRIVTFSTCFEKNCRE